MKDQNTISNTTEKLAHERLLPSVIDTLSDAMEKANVKVTFGLQPKHIEIIEKEIERFGNRDIDGKYVKYIWEKLGDELAWEPFTLALYYFRHLEDTTKNN